MEDGETLWGIARRYEVSVEAVREANELEESATIRAGQTLRIPRAASTAAAGSTRTEPGSSRPGTSSSRPSAERSSSTARPSSSSGSQPAPAARRREHTVGDGETLWGIARRYETTVDSLRRANDLDEDEQIRPGQKLTIPEN